MSATPFESTIAFMSFDVVPAPKGASVHIEAVARALGGAFGGVDLVTLAGERAATAARPWLDAPPARAIAEGVTHHPMPVLGRDMIARALSFRGRLGGFWRGRRARVAHVRGIFEGYPLVGQKGRLFEHLVYEVNGLPSIELKYHYPRVAEDSELIDKLSAQEQACLGAADLVVTPSAVTAAELARRGVPPQAIEVVPNGVDASVFRYRDPRPVRDRPVELVYTGTMTSWQGVHHAIEALRLLRRDVPATLTLIGPARRSQRREIEARARRHDVEPHLRLVPPCSQVALAAMLRQADVALVPLPGNDRNTVQGCCPLKLLEAMASGVPVVASDLPVVTTLAQPEREVVVVRPGSAKALKDGILAVLGDPQRAIERARAARRRIEEHLTWAHADERLVSAYRARFSAALS